MSASMSGKKQCAKCNKSGGIMICDGCQRPFCGKHVYEHRQELGNQLDGIMQEHDLIQQELMRSSDEQTLVLDINKWEEESIAKIRAAAEAARADLQEIVLQSRKELSKVCRDMARDLRSSREAEDFSEKELDRWMEQIKELHLETTSPSSSSIKLCEDKHSVIPLITIKHVNSTDKKHAKSNTVSLVKNLCTATSEDRFWKVLGKAEIDAHGVLVKPIGNSWSRVHVLGQQLYSQGRHMIRFKIEQTQDPDGIYVGCISSQLTDDQTKYNSSFAVGWFGDKVLYRQGVRSENSFSQDSKLKTDDIIRLTLNCDNPKIELLHERINKIYEAQVNIDQSPFPWRLLVGLATKNDSVRILPN